MTTVIELPRIVDDQLPGRGGSACSASRVSSLATATHGMPAAIADLHAGQRILDGQTPTADHAETSRGRQVDLGVRLGVRHVVDRHDDVERRSKTQGVEHQQRLRGVRHRGQRRSASTRFQSSQQAPSRRGTPALRAARDRPASPRRSAGESRQRLPTARDAQRRRAGRGRVGQVELIEECLRDLFARPANETDRTP